jgi:transposase-like protein
MAKQIRLLMKQENDKLTNEVETDETYAPSRSHPRKIGRSKKQTVFDIVERKGKVSAHHVKSSGARVLLPIIQERVERQTVIYSDEYGAYRTLDKLGYSHTTVNHSRLEYVRGRAHTNTIEGFWSQLKRSIDGTYHAVSPKYLQSYVDEFVFRYNHRDEAAGPVLLELALKPVL